MEKVGVDARAGSRRDIQIARCAAIACCLAASAAWAQDRASTRAQERAAAEVRAEQPVRLEVNTSAVPRLESQDSGYQAPRVDLSLLPHGGNGLGVSMGVSGTGGSTVSQPNGLSPRTNMDVGLHLRQTVHSKQVDLTAWRRMTADQDAYALMQSRQPLYGARVEMTLDSRPAKGFRAERGFIGFQLEGGARISIRRKDGRPMVYYRTSF